MTAGGLLIAGRSVPVPGLTIIPPSPAGPHWASLDPGDYRMRQTSWVRQVIIHTTGGHWPQPIIAGGGVPGHAQQIAEMWSGADRGGGDRIHSAAQLLVDFDGTVVCLCDLAYVAAYHAEMSNDWSVGIEMCTRPDGSIYQATLDATVKLVAALCDALGIPEQMPHRYVGEPLWRMEQGAGPLRKNLGGPDCVGVFGHRHNTGNRGRGDPGNAIFELLAAAGFEQLDFELKQDLKVGADRQSYLVGGGARIEIDGKVGPVSLAAARRQGFAKWRGVPIA